MRLLALFVLVPAVTLAGVAASFSDVVGRDKKLIEEGWDMPDAQYLQQNVKGMEKVPFDGVVLRIKSNKDGAAFEANCWGSRRFEMGELADSVEALRTANFHFFTDNFLHFNTCPGSVDWFDDYGVVIGNCALAGRVAKLAGLKGLMFDTEQYNEKLFDYSKQKYKDTRSFDEYAGQAWQRGREVMTALSGDFPDIIIFLCFGHYLVLRQMDGGRPLSECSYGLLAPFLDGMLDACTPETRIVDGYEASYGYKEWVQFLEGYHQIKNQALEISRAPMQYRLHVDAAFGVWMDCNSHKNPWNTEDFSKNHFSPQAFQKALHYALKASDKYVWVRTERVNWWTGEKIPQEYEEALTKAREDP